MKNFLRRTEIEIDDVFPSHIKLVGSVIMKNIILNHSLKYVKNKIWFRIKFRLYKISETPCRIDTAFQRWKFTSIKKLWIIFDRGITHIPTITQRKPDSATTTGGFIYYLWLRLWRKELLSYNDLQNLIKKLYSTYGWRNWRIFTSGCGQNVRIHLLRMWQ